MELSDRKCAAYIRCTIGLPGEIVRVSGFLNCQLKQSLIRSSWTENALKFIRKRLSKGLSVITYTKNSMRCCSFSFVWIFDWSLLVI